MPLAQGLLRERGTCKVQSLIEKSLGNAEDLEPCMNVDCLPLRTVGCRHGVLGKLVVPSEGPETKRRKTSAGEGGQQDHSACCLLSAPPLCAVEPLAWLLSDGRKDSISILGCGAMGSVHLFSSTQRYRVCGLLRESWPPGKLFEVWAVDVWPEHVSVMREKGLRLQGPTGDFTVPIHATLTPEEVPLSDLVIIATKMRDLEPATKLAKNLVKKDGVILAIQNGLGASERLLRHVGSEQAMLGIASNFGACMRGPGHAEHKSMNRIILGEMGAPKIQRLHKVVSMWSSAGFKAEAACNIEQKIWEKLICNVFVGGTCVVTDFTVGQMVDNHFSKQVALACAREAFEVGKAKGINFGFDDMEKFLDTFASTVRDTYPSMAQDHRKRQASEVDVINGAIPLEAAKLGMSAPVNQTVANIIRARELAFSQP
ncbi:apbA [Symbiodinium pilosum]|uniref:ApbA protein n=1 Tax=Symbiodinium pilosum TaxID=2952 RepID=A0A812MTL5_SYMPI|nr:apbA [Symbiodinium pilosum]